MRAAAGIRSPQPVAAAEGQRVAAREPRRYRPTEAAAALLLAGPLFLAVLFVHGFLPGLVSDAPTTYLSEGSVQCLHDLGVSALWSSCHDFGEPLGYPLLTGGPVLGLGALAMYLPGVGASGAFVLAAAIVDAVALAGGYGLLRRLGAGRIVALSAATGFLLTPTVLGLRPFGGTFFGFALLPAYAYADLRVLDAIGRGRPRTVVLAVAAYSGVKAFALFMDGYSFVASNLVSTLLLLAWILSSGVPGRRKAAAVAAFVFANVVALALYTLYVPGTYDANPIEIFRSMGLDVVTLVVPTEWVWPAAKLNYTGDHRDLWGDGTNSTFNYVGVFCLILAIAYVARRPRHPFSVAIAAAGVVALVLAIGPALKVNEVRPATSGVLTYESYLMPKGRALADLPWAGLFTAVPGLKSMRATYRWFAVTRFALIVLAALAIDRLVRRRGRWRWAALVLAGLAIVELMPNVPLYASTARGHYRQIRAMQDSAGAEVRASTRSGEKAFFLNYDGTHNDYLVNYLASAADLRAYNAGGDRNAALSAATWPAEVAPLATPAVKPDDIQRAFATGRVDVVIAPLFHLRWSSYSWPPTRAERVQAMKTFAPLLADRRFRIERRPWIATIRPAGDSGG